MTNIEDCNKILKKYYSTKIIKTEKITPDIKLCYQEFKRNGQLKNKCIIRQQNKQLKNLYKDVEDIDINSNILHYANTIFYNCTENKIYRGKSRKAIILGCLYYSYKIMNSEDRFNELLNIFYITKKEALKGVKYVHGNSSNSSEIRNNHISCLGIIKDIVMRKFNGNQIKLDSILEIYISVSKTDTKYYHLIESSKPYSLASGIIYYWIITNNINININKFSEIIKLSPMTIRSKYKLIENIIVHKNTL